MIKKNTKDNKARLVNERQGQILVSAKRIFAQNGFRRTKIDQIAVDLGVGKGTLYRYFTNKKTLFLAVFEQGMQRLRQTIGANVDQIQHPAGKIAAAVKTYFDFFENDRELIEILMQVRSEFKEDYKRVFLALYSDYIVKIQENLRSGIKTGVFRELDVDKTAEAVSATLQGLLQSFYVREFGSETVSPNDENAADSDKERVQRRELLTDRVEGVTALLLEGLLKRQNLEDGIQGSDIRC